MILFSIITVCIYVRKIILLIIRFCDQYWFKIKHFSPSLLVIKKFIGFKYFNEIFTSICAYITPTYYRTVHFWPNDPIFQTQNLKEKKKKNLYIMKEMMTTFWRPLQAGTVHARHLTPDALINVSMFVIYLENRIPFLSEQKNPDSILFQLSSSIPLPLFKYHPLDSFCENSWNEYGAVSV